MLGKSNAFQKAKLAVTGIHTHIAADIIDFAAAVAANAAVALNTLKVGITPTQASNIVANNAKVSDINHVAALLPNVDNTSDANKPVSTAQQTALDLKENDLGNPAANDYVLVSTTGGVRSWRTEAAISANAAGNLTYITTTLLIELYRQLLIADNFTIGVGGNLDIQGEVVVL